MCYYQGIHTFVRYISHTLTPHSETQTCTSNPWNIQKWSHCIHDENSKKGNKKEFYKQKEQLVRDTASTVEWH